MKSRSVVLLLVMFATLTGCATHGCAGYACKRPDSSNRELVIWWPQDMRQGVDERDNERDYTVVQLKD
ncbi:type III secretion protein [Pseudomonas sp. CDFA 602]|uniref:HrpT family type III secretion system protein n=1 Tax=Pseudomonas californiensis TaxID=2829823 RepID=UPI001E63FAE6|nr:HrpT family type III secretion system protein [Pseudomonas californiensis]MCD5993878.1 type III secretion protein [Pseudomonas californiensis]MCD5999619.1 type III secretion protein [Pseudomonas californiensis]